MERLGELVRALVSDHPEMDVHTDVRDAETVPEGSVMVVVPKPEDAEWLNLRRPLFARRALKVVLFCDRETTIALAQRAVDFFDWVSQHHECPSAPVPHAVSGLRGAAEAKAPGVLWMRAGDLADTGRMWAAFSAAFPGDTLRWVSAEHPQRYEKLIDDIRAAGSAWIACHVDGSTELRRLRWALAEAGRRSPVIALAPPLACPGWWAIHDRLTPLADARRSLEGAQATRPGCVAALSNLEPEAVELARALSAHGLTHPDFVALLKEAPDPGAALAARALQAGLIDRDRVAQGDAPAPALRALSQAPDVRKRRSDQIASVREALAKREDVSDEAVGLWAATVIAPPRVKIGPGRLDAATLGYVMESQLRRRLSAAGWAELAGPALDLGETGAAGLWAQRSIDRAVFPDGALVDVGARLAAMNDWRGIYINGRLASASRPQLTAPAALCGLLSIFPIYMALSTGLEPWDRLKAFAVGAGGLSMSLYHLVRRRLLARALAERSMDALTAMTRSVEAAIELGAQGQPALAVPALKEARDAVRGKLGERHPLYRRLLAYLAMNAAAAGAKGEALYFLEEALSLQDRTIGFDDPWFAELIAVLADVLTHQGSPVESEVLLHKLLGPEGASPMEERVTALPQAMLAGLSDRKSRELVEIFLARPDSRRELAPEVKSRALRHLAEALSAQGRYEEAEHAAEIALERASHGLPTQNPERWRALVALGQVLSLQRRDDDAEQAIEQAAHLVRAAVGERHIDVARTLRELARIKARRHDPAAASVAQEALAAYAAIPCGDDERDAAHKELIRISEQGGDPGGASSALSRKDGDRLE
ncbi:tetratricopeptide repeat protein [Sorangium sp. So ce124]|uniref:tetratricopeptide repeat protein n=1 Tax=Sorangium sp. So ce124 TaxID=3133280 RepID=UPI003F646C92